MPGALASSLEVSGLLLCRFPAILDEGFTLSAQVLADKFGGVDPGDQDRGRSL